MQLVSALINILLNLVDDWVLISYGEAIVNTLFILLFVSGVNSLLQLFILSNKWSVLESSKPKYSKRDC